MRFPYRSLLLALSFSAAGCDLADGLGDLGDGLVLPDAALLDAPGRRVAEGTYRNLVIDGSLDKGGYVLSFRTDTKSERLSIVPFVEGDGCEVDDAVAFDRVSSRVDVALPGLVAVEVKNGDSTRLRFVGFDCKDRLPPLDAAGVPRLSFPSDKPLGVLTLSAAKKLYLIDPKAVEVKELGENVTYGQTTSTRIFTIESGSVRVRNSELKVIATLGEEVTEFVAGNGTDVEVVYHDKTGLHAWSKAEGQRDLGADACGARLSTISDNSFAYFQPCSTRRLILDLDGSLIGSEAKRVRVIGPENVDLSGGIFEYYNGLDADSHVAVIVNDAVGALDGRLFSATLVRPKDKTAEELTLTDPVEVGSNLVIRQNSLYQSWNGTSGDYYVFFEPTPKKEAVIVRLAPSVAANFGSIGVIAAFDGELGEFWSLPTSSDPTDTEHEVLGKGVPVQFIDYTDRLDEFAFIANVKKGNGDLLFVKEGKATTLAENAIVSSQRYVEQPKAFAYLKPESGDSGSELHAYLLDSDLDLKVNAGVTEYRPVPWPSPGILYAVGFGEKPGLWFTKAR